MQVTILTEIKPEEQTGELKKKIQTAERIIDHMFLHLARQVPVLVPYKEMLVKKPVREKTILFETDGISLYYNPEKLIRQYQDHWLLQATEQELLHIYLHGILGHFSKRRWFADKKLMDAVMDLQVSEVQAQFLGETLYGEQEGIGLLGKSAVELYQKACRNKEVGRFLDVFRKKDHHELWKDIDGIREEKNRWEIVSRQLFGTENPAEEFNAFMGRITGKSNCYGNKTWGEEEEYQFLKKGGGSYRTLWDTLLKQREISAESQENFDKRLYWYGIQKYGNVALLEPEEEDDQLCLDTLYIALDTSGSCAGSTMHVFLRELRSMLIEMQQEVKFQEIILLQCDMAIQNEQRFRTAEEISAEGIYKIFGCGGTSFVPVFERIEQIQRTENREPDGLIYFTDGYGMYPSENPGYPVIFLEEEILKHTPDWVQQIKIQGGKG